MTIGAICSQTGVCCGTRRAQASQNVRSVFGKGVVRIAVQPMLARLCGCYHRMTARVRMFAGVPIRRAIAAERDAARLARAQMDPI